MDRTCEILFDGNVGNETESCGTVVRLRLNWPGLILTIVVG